MRCSKCGKPLNPVQASVSENTGRCGDCIRKLHKKVAKKQPN